MVRIKKPNIYDHDFFDFRWFYNLFLLSVRSRCSSADCAAVVELEWHCFHSPGCLTLGFMTTAAVGLPPTEILKRGKATCRV